MAWLVVFVHRCLLIFLQASRAALSASGTAIMELQLARLPCVVAYRAHFITEWFIKYRTKLQYISLPNILLDSDVIPEALFQACTPKNLASLIWYDFYPNLCPHTLFTARMLREIFPETNVCGLYILLA